MREGLQEAAHVSQADSLALHVIARGPAALIQVLRKIAGILIDPVGSRAFEFIFSVTSGEAADPEGSGAPRSEQIPYAVAHHDR
jgi:hypothetical protein